MKNTILLTILFGVLLCSCAQAPVQTSMPTINPAILTQIAPTQQPTSQPTAETIIPTITMTAETQPTVYVLPTLQIIPQTDAPVLSGFTITATHGNLTIHRGPGVEYSIIGYFLKAQSYAVIGRMGGKWLMVNLSKPGVTAWVSNMTAYADVNGSVPGLPVIKVDPAVPAYIYNCTNHKLSTSPNNYYIEPWSKEQVNPYDFYYIYDLDITQPDGYHPIVDKITVTEGEKANVHKDGDGNSYTCPDL